MQLPPPPNQHTCFHAPRCPPPQQNESAFGLDSGHGNIYTSLARNSGNIPYCSFEIAQLSVEERCTQEAPMFNAKQRETALVLYAFNSLPIGTIRFF